MSDIQLKPCPLRQSIHVCIMQTSEQDVDSQKYYGFCYNCCAEAGLGDTEEQAAGGWNALPRHLHWSKEPPQDADYDIWLWREYPGNMPQPYTIYWAAQAVKGKVEKVLVAQADLEDDRVRRVSSMGGEWAGPIQLPKEAEK